MITEKLFTEMFRAKELDEMILLPRVKNALAHGLVQNVMLYSSSPGTGKSTIARILTKNYDTLKLNGSSENGIDVIRNQVINFAASVSLEDGIEKLKVVYIDEADGLTDAAWDALRETIEKYADPVRFVCTCNRINKIPEPILSRFLRIPMFPVTKEEEDYVFAGYCERTKKILDKLEVKYTDECLYNFVKSAFPDMRKILNTLQTLYTQQVKELSTATLSGTVDCSDLFNLIIQGNDPVENYKFIISNYGTTPDEALINISEGFVEYMMTYYPQLAAKIPFIVIAIAEYVAQLSTSPDKVVVLLACCFKLQTIIRMQ